MNPNITAYWEHSVNFGDALTPYIVEKITGTYPLNVSPEMNHGSLMVTGSIAAKKTEHAKIWGIGFGDSSEEPILPYGEVHAVRGPLTRARLLAKGVSCPDVYGDPGWLVPKICRHSYIGNWGLMVVPHYVDYYNAVQYFDNEYNEKHGKRGYLAIDLLTGVDSVLENLVYADYVASSSLHGLVVAEAFGIPTVWIKFEGSRICGDDFKFADYYSSFTTIPEPVTVTGNTHPDELIEKATKKEIPQDMINRLYNAFPLKEYI